MSNFYKTDELIESVKQRAFIPENQSTFTTEKFLRFANEEMMVGIVPKVMVLHEEHFVYTVPVPLQADLSNYPIPYRAMGSKLYELAYQDTNGNIFEMSRIGREDITGYPKSYSFGNANLFFMENDEVVLVPAISGAATGSLLMSYYMRPNKLVDEDRAGQITDINRTTGVVTLTSFPKNFSTDILYDFIKTKSPHVVLGLDVVPIAISTTFKSVTFNPNDIPARLVVGDYLMEAEETIIPTIPSDLHSILAQRVACRCLEAMGDTQGLTNANAKLKEMNDALDIVIDNRVEGAPRKVVNRNGHLRSGMNYRGYGR